jgi:cytochrome c5
MRIGMCWDGSFREGLHPWLVAVVLICASPVYGAQPPEGQRSGKEVVDKVCVACHGSGVNGAPKIGDADAWSKRTSRGLTGLTQSALKGIRQMPAHGGHPELSDLEVARAVTYMVNQSGGHWVEPTSSADKVRERSGEQVVKMQCARCHRSGKDGAPKIGDQSAWVSRMKQGLDYLVHSAIRGHGGMPERGGKANLTDGEIRGAILYMFNPNAPAGDSRAARDEAAPSGLGSNHVVVGKLDIYFGVVSAERLRNYPKDSPERTMHGGVPSTPGYYHINISLADRENHAPIGGAKVEVEVDRAGLTRESKVLEPMMSNAGSYGNYVKMTADSAYVITADIQVPGSSSPVRARFDYRAD